MRGVGEVEHVDRLLAATRTCWGDGGRRVPAPGAARCVVAEAFDEDLRVVVRTLMVARAICGLVSARLVVPGRPEWRRLAEAFGATFGTASGAASGVVDGRPGVPPAALVTSRVDRAVPREIPVVHVGRTGALKAYALFPDQGPCSVEEELPARVGAFFERHVWPYRQVIRSSAERVAWRAKSGYQVRTETERRQLRYYGCSRLGLDADRPTIVVFGHAPERDAELFATTAEFAAADESANWLFLDDVPARHSRIRSVTGALSPNLLWSMADAGVTFGDSDLPAFGVPVIQAGWSEGGACGATHVPRSAGEHRLLLRETITRHAKGESILGPEQRERARLWLWLRRCGSDVPSQVLPLWEHGADYGRTLAVNLRHAEIDGDALYAAVARMWQRREPVLTRFDFHDPAGLATTLTASRSYR